MRSLDAPLPSCTSLHPTPGVANLVAGLFACAHPKPPPDILRSLPCVALRRNSPKEEILLPSLCTKLYIQREGYLFCCYLFPPAGLGLWRGLRKSGQSNNGVEILGCCVHVLPVKGSISGGLSLFRGISQLMVSWMLWMFLPKQMTMRTTIHRCIVCTYFLHFCCWLFPNQFEKTNWCTTKKYSSLSEMKFQKQNNVEI